MAVREWVKIALGWPVPHPVRIDFPRAPKIIVIAPNARAARLWLYEEQLNPSDAHIVVDSRYGADRLRGIGPGRDVVWVHGPPWNHLDLERLEERVAIIRGRYGFNSERHVYV
jgi:hypothetical protein